MTNQIKVKVFTKNGLGKTTGYFFKYFATYEALDNWQSENPNFETKVMGVPKVAHFQNDENPTERQLKDAKPLFSHFVWVVVISFSIVIGTILIFISSNIGLGTNPTIKKEMAKKNFARYEAVYVSCFVMGEFKPFMCKKQSEIEMQENGEYKDLKNNFSGRVNCELTGFFNENDLFTKQGKIYCVNDLETCIYKDASLFQCKDTPKN